MWQKLYKLCAPHWLFLIGLKKINLLIKKKRQVILQFWGTFMPHELTRESDTDAEWG